jgi:hypothetical protein
MRHPLVRQGEGPEAAHQRLTREQNQAQRKLDRIYDDASDGDAPDLNSRKAGRGTLPGDSRKLRGIPAIGRNVAGAIPGTSPHSLLSVMRGRYSDE